MSTVPGIPAGRDRVERALKGIVMPRTIRTKRMILTQIEKHHLSRFAELWGDARTTRFIGGPADRAGAFFRMAAFSGLWRLYGFGAYALTSEDGRVYGYAGLWFPHNWPEVEIAYALHPEAVGQGLAAEAVRAIRAIAEAAGIPSLISTIDPANLASQRVAAAAGAVRDGDFVVEGQTAELWRYPMSPGEVDPEEVVVDARVMPLRIRTARLTLRQWHPDDFPRFATHLADEETMRFIGGVQSLHWASRHFIVAAGQWHLLGYGFYAVEHEGRFVGSVGLYHPLNWPQPEIAYNITADARRQGLASEAVRAVRDVAAEQGLTNLVSYIHPANTASLAVARSVGASHDGDIDLTGTVDQVWRHSASAGANTIRELEPAL